MPDIFISYSREDRERARQFASCFTAEGFNVWWDAALHSGQTFDEVIERELKAAKAVVVLWSPRSVRSRWVRAEATIADRRNKLIPVAIEACDRPIIFELTHTADLSDWSGEPSAAEFQTLLNDLRRLIGGAAASVEPKALRAPEAHRTVQHATAEFKSRAAFAAASERDRVPQAQVDRLMFALTSEREAPRSASRIGEREAAESDRTQTEQRFGRPAPANDEFHCLELHVGDKFERRYVVSRQGLRIGRTAPADVILADARVSRSHCMVELSDNSLRVLDLQSTNGTFVNGERVTGHAMLEVGSVLRVGNMMLKHQIRSSAEV